MNNEKVILITGATSGIGAEMAKELARKEERRIILHGRNPEKAEALKDEINRIGGEDKARTVIADFSSMEEAKKAAEKVKKDYKKLDVLINNAGFIAKKRRITKDGLEETLAVNHFSHFLLTNELFELLKNAAGARIIHVSSRAHEFINHIDFDDSLLEKRYSAWRAYALSKLFNLLFSLELSKRWKKYNITSNSFHPGVVASNFGQSSSVLFKLFYNLAAPLLRGSKKAAETGVYLAFSDEIEDATGKYFVDKKQRKPSSLAQDEGIAKKLWEVSEDILEEAL